MTIYEIDQTIMNLLGQVDEETGEALFDVEQLEALQMERDRKIENLALAYKNLIAEAKAIKAEEEALSKRRKVTENEAERAKNYLEFVLNGETYKSAKAAVSYRRSESVEIQPDFVEWAYHNNPSLLRMREPDADKTAIKAALKNGEEIPYAVLVPKQSMTIK